uniref:Transmembrane protein 144 n=1 Tax=Syphacia muris TaxID=451379 RepID=A0A0N5AWR6_9BILA
MLSIKTDKKVLGTLLATFSIPCCAKVERCSKVYAFWMNLLAAVIQFVTFPLVVGCVWSVYWGVLFIMTAQEHQTTRGVNNGCRNQLTSVHGEPIAG